MKEYTCDGCNEQMSVDTCASQLIPEFEKDKMTLTCPCLDCIVKSMCSVSCKKFSKYTDILFDLRICPKG